MLTCANDRRVNGATKAVGGAEGVVELLPEVARITALPDTPSEAEPLEI